MNRVQSFGEKWGFRTITTRPWRSGVRSPNEKLLLLQGLIARNFTRRGRDPGQFGGGRGTGVEPSLRSPAYSSELWRRGFWQGHGPRRAPSPLAGSAAGPYHYTASFAALARRALTIFRAGLALNIIASPVKKTARRPIRPSKSCRLAMPDECGVWMRAPWDEAGQLQRPLLQIMLKIVASGEREDPHSQAAQSQPSLPL
jgi:hypothetical protein